MKYHVRLQPESYQRDLFIYDPEKRIAYRAISSSDSKGSYIDLIDHQTDELLLTIESLNHCDVPQANILMDGQLVAKVRKERLFDNGYYEIAGLNWRVNADEDAIDRKNFIIRDGSDQEIIYVTNEGDGGWNYQLLDDNFDHALATGAVMAIFNTLNSQRVYQPVVDYTAAD